MEEIKKNYSVRIRTEYWRKREQTEKRKKYQKEYQKKYREKIRKRPPLNNLKI